MRFFDYSQNDAYEELTAFLEGRKAENSDDVEKAVKEIIAKVRKEGDVALRYYNEKFDGATVEDLRVSEEEMSLAFAGIDKALLGTLEKAARNIRRFHEKQLEKSWFEQREDGTVLGMKVDAIGSVGLYVPGGAGGKTPLPSSVLMNGIPARVAGVERIIMSTPPGPDGSVNPAILVAAKLAGIHDIFKVGGAQAIAAMAYGTKTIAKVDKIAGPGNAFVATAKKIVFGQCGIDMVAGPSEVLVIADQNADPVHLAADLLAQAEHDPLASAVLVSPFKEILDATGAEMERALPQMERYGIAKASVDNFGALILTKNLEEAITIANLVAPEHLELAVDDPFPYIGKIKTAGALFLGHYTPEALGDYLAGPNHVLPTIGTARFSSPLNTGDFMKKTSILYFNRESFLEVREDISRFARAEGLTGHARSAEIRK